MKLTPSLITLLTIILITGCSKYRVNFLHEKNKLIAIQPLGDFDSLQLTGIREQMANFYQRKVIVLPPMVIPPGYLISQDYGLYSADSILNLLSSIAGNNITEVVGLTHVNICTARDPALEEGPVSPDIKIIFGMSRLPGNVCLVSDHRLKDPDSSVLQHRIMTVILHEMGHNLGLNHCKVTQCIMSGANGHTAVLDKNENYYCDKCKSILK
jgi:archaemetzincin